MSKGEEYFLREWTVRERDVDGKPTPHKTPESISDGYRYRFHRQGGRIVCEPVGPNRSERDAWIGTAFVHDVDHERLLGVVVLKGHPYVLEITPVELDGKEWIRCSYIIHDHMPHEKEPSAWHMGYWHGDNG